MMNQKLLERLSSWDIEKLEKYIKAFISKIPQVIIQSRFGEKRKCTSKSNSQDSDVYEIALEDNLEIETKTKVACSSVHPFSEFCLCIEILLETADGDTLVLEVWTLRMINSETFWDCQYRVYAEPEILFTNLMVLLKSVISVSRAVPAFKLSLYQSKDTYVILYRIYPGEPQVEKLGRFHEKSKIGEVYTPVGTISVSVAYRSKHDMTIAPQCAEKDNFLIESNYFNCDMSPKKHSEAKGTQKHIFRNNANTEIIGAFAHHSSLPDTTSSDLAFLEKPFLISSRCNLDNDEKKLCGNAALPDDINSNSLSDSWHFSTGEWSKGLKDCERLSTSDASNSSDFVVVDLKPPSFASCSSLNDLSVFFKECHHAPQLSTFASQPSLVDQLFDLTSELEKYETDMIDFDNFVDSICQSDPKN